MRRDEGGTFCQFRVGASVKGGSSRTLRYMARPEAVRDGQEGTLLHNIPSVVAERADYKDRIAALCHYAREQERFELSRHRSRGLCRTHYRAIVSFERDPGTEIANSLVASWLVQTFPLARAAAFLHRNTSHLHAHLWVEARQVNGSKISLSARAYRQLDEAWNRLYAEAFGRDEREHLWKKWRTEGHKRMRREGQDIALPERVGHDWRPERFTERERTRLSGAIEIYDREEGGIGDHQRPVAGDNSEPAAGECIIDPAESAAAREDAELRALYREAHRALSEIEALYHKMATRERGTPGGTEGN